MKGCQLPRPLIEMLESRQLLSASPLSIAGTYAGSLRLSGHGANHDVVLVVSSESKTGTLSGTIDVSGVGLFSFTGEVGRRKLRLNLSNASGTIGGFVTGNGQFLKGKFSEGSNSGTLSLSKQAVSGQRFRRTRGGTTLVNAGTLNGAFGPIAATPSNNPPGFANPANGFGFNNGINTGLGTANAGGAGVFGPGTSVFGTGTSIFGTPAGSSLFTTPTGSELGTGINFGTGLETGTAIGAFLNTGTGFDTGAALNAQSNSPTSIAASQNLGATNTAAIVNGTGTNLFAAGPLENGFVNGPNGPMGF